MFANFIFFVACMMFWPVSLNYALENYLWGFVKDVFGACAASGYMDVYGWECLP